MCASCQHRCLQTLRRSQMQQGKKKKKEKKKKKKKEKKKKKNPFRSLASGQHACQAVQEQGEEAAVGWGRFGTPTAH